TRYRANIMGRSGKTYINALVRLKGGAAAIPAFRKDLAKVTKRSDVDMWNNRVNFGEPTRKVTGYEAACLLAFALAALVAAFFLVGQSVARYTSATVVDLQVLQAVGMTRRQAVTSASAAPFLAGVAGATVGVVGAIAGVLGVLAAFTFSAGVSDAAANPARFGQTWQLGTFLGLNGRDFGPASQVLRAVAADRDVIGVEDARIAGAQSGQVSIESFTYAPVAGKRLPIV